MSAHTPASTPIAPPCPGGIHATRELDRQALRLDAPDAHAPLVDRRQVRPVAVADMTKPGPVIVERVARLPFLGIVAALLTVWTGFIYLLTFALELSDQTLSFLALRITVFGPAAALLAGLAAYEIHSHRRHPPVIRTRSGKRHWSPCTAT